VKDKDPLSGTEKKTPEMRSLWPILRLLDTEGFTEYAAARIQRYHRKRVADQVRQMQSFERNKKRLSEVMRNLSPADRLVIGKFMSIKEAMAFDAGLRIGLTARVTLPEQPKEGE